MRDDGGYIGSPGFRERPTALKLVNAAHFEMLAHRQLGTRPALHGAFVPPGGAAAGGAVVAAPTQTEAALFAVSERFRKAWTMGLWLYDRYHQIYRNPKQWVQPLGSGVVAHRALRYWSKVAQLTIHERPNIDTASSYPARAPVTLIDLALAETLARRMSQAMNAVPPTEAQARAIGVVYPDGDNWQYVFKPADEQAALLRYFVSRFPISGDTARDVKSVNELSSKDWMDIGKDRDPAAF